MRRDRVKTIEKKAGVTKPKVHTVWTMDYGDHKEVKGQPAPEDIGPDDTFVHVTWYMGNHDKIDNEE